MAIPRFAANCVLFDIDDTITYLIGRSERNCFLETLCDLVVEAQGVSRDEAHEAILARLDPERESLGPHIEPLGVSFDVYWTTLVSRLRKQVAVHSDAADAIRELRRNGFRLYTATTNARLACLAKLAVGGLADRIGSPFFDDLFGGSEVTPDGKSGPSFFRAILERIDAEAREVVVVGDSPRADLGYARAAGIEQVILPRRDQDADWIREPDGGVYVKSLRIVAEMVRLP